jgi:hypothetical protein
MPRKKGVRNKDSWVLLKKLEAGGFHVANEFIELYNSQKKILGGIIDKMLENKLGNRPLTEGLNEDDVQIYMSLSKEQMGSILRALAYLYPKLKAIEHGTGTGDKIVFNISGMPEIVNDPKEDQENEEVVIH